jgi:RNase P subunit RPR2
MDDALEARSEYLAAFIAMIRIPQAMKGQTCIKCNVYLMNVGETFIYAK